MLPSQHYAVDVLLVLGTLWGIAASKIRYRNFRIERAHRWQVEDRLDNTLDRNAILEARTANRERLERDTASLQELVVLLRAKINKLEAVAMGGDAKCPQCARLRNRIVRFFEQKRKLKEAYVERVMMVSHGQCDPRALVDAERYLLEDDDGQIRTFGEIRDAEITRALYLLKAANVATTDKKEIGVGAPEPQNPPEAGPLPETPKI